MEKKKKNQSLVTNKDSTPNEGGRPPADLVQMAKDLVEWSYLPDSLNLIGFSSPRRMSVTKLPEWAEKDTRFREALSLSKQNISQNRFKAACSGTMPQQFFTRCEYMYDPLHHKWDREEKEFESSLKSKEEGVKQPVTVNLIDYSKEKP